MVLLRKGRKKLEDVIYKTMMLVTWDKDKQQGKEHTEEQG